MESTDLQLSVNFVQGHSQLSQQIYVDAESGVNTISGREYNMYLINVILGIMSFFYTW